MIVWILTSLPCIESFYLKKIQHRTCDMEDYFSIVGGNRMTLYRTCHIWQCHFRMHSCFLLLKQQNNKQGKVKQQENTSEIEHLNMRISIHPSPTTMSLFITLNYTFKFIA